MDMTADEDEEYSYIIEDCNELPAEKFSGAGNRFTATLRINLNNGKRGKRLGRQNV